MQTVNSSPLNLQLLTDRLDCTQTAVQYRWLLLQERHVCLLQVNCKYGLLTKCEVKMAGYWPSSFFACLWTEMESRSINTQKKNEVNIQPS